MTCAPSVLLRIWPRRIMETWSRWWSNLPQEDVRWVRRRRKGRCVRTWALAEELGAHVVTVQGDDPAVQIAQYVPAAGIGRVVLGSSGKRRTLFSASARRWRRLDAFSLGSLAFPSSPMPARGASRHGGTIAYFAFFITRCLDCFGCNCCLVLGRLRRVSDGVRIAGGADALFCSLL